MKIAILVDELPTSSAPKTIGEEAYYLERLGIKAHAYVLKRRANEVAPAHVQQIKLAHLDDKLCILARLCGWRVPTFSFFSLYHAIYPYILPPFINEKLNEYDAIIAHFASTAIFASRLHFQNTRLLFYYWDPISYIFTSAYMELWSRRRRKLLSSAAILLDKKLLSKPDIILLPSKFHQQRIRDLGVVKPIRVVYPGTEVAPEVPEKRGGFVLAVARWEAGKNPFFLIDIAEKLKRNCGFQILLAGPWRPTALSKVFLRNAKVRGLAENFKILGPKFGDQLKELYLNARCLVHAKVEAFGFPGLEAVAHGCPIVFPKGSGVTELFTHGVHGFFPREVNVDDYAEYIGKLLSDERFAWKMGYEAWKTAKRHTWERHAKELVESVKLVM